MTYGDVAEFCELSTPRIVGRLLATEPDDTLPWHRVLRADGSFAPHLAARQRELLEAEGVAFVRGRVDLRQSRWGGVTA